MGDLVVWLFFGAFILGALMYMWPVLLIIGIVWVGVKIAGSISESNTIDRQYRKDREADLIGRADKQHHAIISGDLVTGTYGDYLPPKGLR